MPTDDELPEDIRALVRRNGIELSATRWRTDVERLIKELDRVMKPSTGPSGLCGQHKLLLAAGWKGR